MVDRFGGVLVALALLFSASAAASPQASAAPLQPLLSYTADGSALIAWQAPAALQGGDLAALDQWPQLERGGWRLPATLLTLEVADAAPTPTFLELAMLPWAGPQPAAALPDAPQRVDPSPLARRSSKPGETAPQRNEEQKGTKTGNETDGSLGVIPATPVWLLRESRQAGRHLLVFAVTPLFQQAGRWTLATRLAVRLEPGQTPAASVAAAAAPPTNPLASGAATLVRVRSAGLQQITGAALAATGLNLQTLTPDRLQLTFRGAPVALQALGTGDGRLDSADSLLFYAPAPLDRYNPTDVYWLTVGAAAGLRMSGRSVTPGSAPLRDTARETGSWRAPTFYDSTQPGPLGDHWFSADLTSGPGLPAATLTVPLTPTLPLANDSTTLTFAGAAYTSGARQVNIQMGAAQQSAASSGGGNWSQRFTLPANAASATLTLTAAQPAGLEVAEVRWDRAVTLTFGGRGARFNGLDGSWRYQLQGVAAGNALYDITDPQRPTLLNIPAGSAPQFEDSGARAYLLAGSGTRFVPQLNASVPLDLAAPRAADAVYLAPAALQAALAPLVAQRRAQGYRVEVLDPQALYAAWSDGMVAPEAIRRFLQYARANWQPAPRAVVLVGDGTRDPWDYSRNANPNLIPPYLLPVDPWLGETACEACYAQLDGDSPLDDVLPDVQIGRLPVKSASELSALVTKILAYERAPLDMTTSGKAVYINDNYRELDGSSDPAGDFTQVVGQLIGGQPAGVTTARLSYDPTAPSANSWREPQAAKARARTQALLTAGSGVVTYVGHSNQYQWAYTNASAAPYSYLFGLYDVDLLTNAAKLPIVLELTCLTSAFDTPTFSGTTIDERLVLNPKGGAIAVFGSSGDGVGHGHDALGRGFLSAIWQGRGRATIGSLVQAGQTELFTNGTCCQDLLRTYLVLGDPLTPARALAPQRALLPWVRR